ncbi:MAG: ribonuclease HII [Candidatus Woesearchaeota archaeon]|jgi:ribonuclease HII|nr:ribonuclease HII [Candidatus Woesearchaeota archaeon]
MYKVIGIDEAGKGPVLGSMFIGFSIINLANGLKDLNEYQDNLKSIGVKDSKLLTSKKRNELYQILKDTMDLKYAQITPALIDSNNAQGGKLNELEVDAIVKILESEKPDLVMIDALTANPEKFGQDILKKLSFEPKMISENKADVKYTIVGAASIAAKELREQELEEIRKNIGIDCGSGYPADPKTKAFLKEHYESKEFDFIFRKSWQTYKNLVGDKTNKSLLDF